MSTEQQDRFIAAVITLSRLGVGTFRPYRATASLKMLRLRPGLHDDFGLFVGGRFRIALTGRPFARAPQSIGSSRVYHQRL